MKNSSTDRNQRHIGGYGERPRGMSRKRWKNLSNDDPRKYRKFTLNIPTPDNFCGTYPDGTVVVYVTTRSEPFSVTTSVWGTDDFGFLKDEIFQTQAEAEDCFQRRVKEVQQWAIVTIKMLKELGFVGA